MRRGTSDGGSFDRSFRTGVRLNWYIFFLSLAFLVFWGMGFPGNNTLLSSADFHSKVFFFLNPNVFRKVFLEGFLFSFLSSSVNEFSFLFLISYLACVVIFALQVLCCIRLFFISYEISVRPFHSVSCLGLFPIIAFFLIFIFSFRLLVFQIETRRRRRSKYSAMFREEKFEDPLLKDFDEETYVSRPITSEFGKRHYDRFFGEKKRRDILAEIHKKLDSSLS